MAGLKQNRTMKKKYTRSKIYASKNALILMRRYLRDDLGYTSSEIRQVLTISKYLDCFRFKGTLIDFRGV